MTERKPVDFTPASPETMEFKEYIQRSNIPKKVADGYNLGSDDAFKLANMGAFPGVVLAYKLGFAKGWRAAKKHMKEGKT